MLDTTRGTTRVVSRIEYNISVRQVQSAIERTQKRRKSESIASDFRLFIFYYSKKVIT